MGWRSSALKSLTRLLWALVVVASLPQRLFDGVAQLLLLLRDGRSAQLLTQDHVEGRRQLACDLALVAEQQPLEERHVELPSQPVVGLAVGCVAVASSGQYTRQVGLGLLEVARDLRQATFDVGDFGRQAILLALEQ